MFAKRFRMIAEGRYDDIKQAFLELVSSIPARWSRIPPNTRMDSTLKPHKLFKVVRQQCSSLTYVKLINECKVHLD